ncbi:hypothetical protein KA068_02800 [Candidatus Saccharibacteria bacterium]|nr:hypothetical protein [Candidatus Saccharibacteria bacterium]
MLDTRPKNTYEEPYRPEFELLVAHSVARESTDGRLNSISGEQLRALYLTLTDDLILETEKLFQGEDGKEYDNVHIIFLDKSARPISWLMRELWPETQKVLGKHNPLPSMHFAAIDRERWPSLYEKSEGGIIETQDEEIRNGIRNNKNTSLLVDEIRRKYGGESPRSSGVTSKRIENSKSTAILVVDEVNSSGATLALGRSFFKEAFPEAEVISHTWMPAYNTSGPNGPMTKQILVPVWYNSSTGVGRGIGEFRPGSMISEPVIRLGGNEIRAGIEPKSLKLREELGRLAVLANKPIREGGVPFFPTSNRLIEEYDRLISTFNGEDPNEMLNLRNNAGFRERF